MAVFYNKYRDFINEDAALRRRPAPTFQASNIKHATIKGVEAKGRLNLDAFGAPQGLYYPGFGGLCLRPQRRHRRADSIASTRSRACSAWATSSRTTVRWSSWTLVKKQNRVDSATFFSPDGDTTKAPFKTPGFGIVDLTGFYKVTNDVTINGGLYNLTDKKYWNWDDVRSYDSVGEAGVTAPANIDRLTQPGRNFAIDLIWDI